MRPSAAQINAELELLLGLSPGDLKGSEALIDVHWDSMSAIMFMAVADEKFGSKIPTDKLASAKTVADLQALFEVG